jgi:hypothetical protein
MVPFPDLEFLGRLEQTVSFVPAQTGKNFGGTGAALLRWL